MVRATASKAPTAGGAEKTRGRRLRIPRRLFADALTFPDVRVRSGGKDHTITFQKAALLALQAAAEERLARLVEEAVSLPSFHHKTLMAADFQAATRLTR